MEIKDTCTYYYPTICNGINALKNSVHPFYVFPRAITNSDCLFGAPTGSASSTHISGWMTEEDTFLEFLKHFTKHIICFAAQESFVAHG